MSSLAPFTDRDFPSSSHWQLNMPRADGSTISEVQSVLRWMCAQIRHHRDKRRFNAAPNGFINFHSVYALVRRKPRNMNAWEFVQVAWQYRYPTFSYPECRFQFGIQLDCQDPIPAPNKLWIRITRGLNADWYTSVRQTVAIHLLAFRSVILPSICYERRSPNCYPLLFVFVCVRTLDAPSILQDGLLRMGRIAVHTEFAIGAHDENALLHCPFYRYGPQGEVNEEAEAEDQSVDAYFVFLARPILELFPCDILGSTLMVFGDIPIHAAVGC